MTRAERNGTTPHGSLFLLGDLHVYWCPSCKIQTSRPWHVAERPNALIPQLDVEHECIRIAVEPSLWALCGACGTISPDALWTYWHHNLDEATEEETPWVPARPGEEDPMARCPVCKHEHVDTDGEPGFYVGSLGAMQSQREADEPEAGEWWAHTLEEAAMEPTS